MRRFHWLNEIKGPVTWLTVAFFVSRLCVHKAGVVFYSTFVHRLWQAIDIELLQTRFWESLLYSHAQPPLFNAITGILVNVFPEQYGFVYHLFNTTLSLATVILIYLTLRRLAVADWLAVTAALLLILSPAAIAYENLYSYTTLTIFLVMAVASSTVFLFSTGNLRYHVLFLTALVLLVLMRSSFHLFWMIGMIGTAMVLQMRYDGLRRQAVLAAAVAVVVAGSWYIKNLILFNKFAASSWMGMNLARVLPPSTDLGTIGTFRNLEAYHGRYEEFRGFDDVPLLNNRVKLRHPYPNFFHKDYIPVSDALLRDFLNELRQEPARYAWKVGYGTSIFFSPATHAPFIEKNLERLEPLTTLIAFDFARPQTYTAMQRDVDDRVATQSFMVQNNLGTTYALPAALLFLFLAVALGGLVRRKGLSRPEKSIVLVLLVLYAYGALVGILLEFGENNRFRLELQPVMFVLIPFAVSRLWNTAKRHKAF